MDITTIVLGGVAILFGALWMRRRRARLRNGSFE